MTSPLTTARFAIVPIISDSRRNEVVPPNAIMVGSQSAVMESVLDSKARNDAVTLVHKAAEAGGILEEIQEREQSVAKKEDAVNTAVRSQMMQDFIGKMDALASRIDQLEHELAEQAHDPDDDLLSVPPAPTADDGELAAVQVPEIEKYQDPDQPRNPVAAEDA